MKLTQFVSGLGLIAYVSLPANAPAEIPGLTDPRQAPQPTPSGQTCEPPQVCATPAPARKKSSGPSKAVKDLRLQVGTLQQKDSQLEGILSTYGRMFNLMKDRLEGHLQGYEALKQQVDTLASNPSLRILGDVFRGEVTPSKNAMEAACRTSATAYKTFAEGEVNYQSTRNGLLGKISAAAINTSYTPMQQAAEAGKFKKELDALDAQHKKGKDGTDKSAALCTKSQQDYDSQVKAFNARKKELEEWVKRNLTARPDQFTLSAHQGWLYNDGANQASTSARVGYNTKRGWTFSLEGGLLYGEATSTSVSFGTSGERTPVGDDLQREYNEEGTRTTSQRYQNLLQLGVEKSWKLDKARKVSLGLGVTAGVLSGEETTTENATRILALYDNAGNAVGDSQTVTESTTNTETLRDFVVGANAELRRKFWGNLDAALGGALLYDTKLNRTLPRVYLGLGANW